MAIVVHIDGWDHVRNFEKAYFGPGVYVLFDGPPRSDGSIVYIGKSSVDVMVRVSAHLREKDFDRVGVILPRKTTPGLIHNLEHMVMTEFLDRFGELPPYNRQFPQLNPWVPSFNWHSLARRRADLLFI